MAHFLQFGVKAGVITAIYKSGDKFDPTNYRGNCVNSCLGKLFCSILNNRLITADHIFSLKTLIDKYVIYTSKGKLFSCFVDFKKAFDSI